MPDNIKAIIFDVDQTITQEVSWYFITRSFGASEKSHSEIFTRFQEGGISYIEAKKQLIQLWSQTGNANKSFMRNAFLNLELKPDAKRVISQLAESYKVYLISGSMDLFIETVAEKLNISDWYANTKLYFAENGQLIDFDYTLDQANKKWEQFSKLLIKTTLSVEEYAVIGNGEGDKLLFENLGFAVLVDSQEKTEQLVDMVDMEVKNLTELLDIF
jgi:HAD superfamily phosphoserine phosphatase-like hydrolase